MIGVGILYRARAAPRQAGSLYSIQTLAGLYTSTLRNVEKGYKL